MERRFSERMAYVCTKLGCSRRALADMLGVSYASVSQWIAGIREPRVRSKIRFYSLCAAYGIKFEDVPDAMLTDFIGDRGTGLGKGRKQRVGYKS